MKKLLIITSVIWLFLIAGCTAKSEQNAAAPQITIESAQPQPTATAEAMDYSNYAGNWVLISAEDENIELCRIEDLLPYHSTTDLTIEEILNGHVKGSILAASAAVNATDYHMAYVEFEGDIADGLMQATYEDDGWGCGGSIELTFGDNEITVKLTRDKPVSETQWGIPEGTFAFLRQIDTEDTPTSFDESVQLEQLFSLVTDDVTQPFQASELTDAKVIQILTQNIGLGSIDLTEFGDQVQAGTEITVNQSVIEALSKRYFGIDIQEHQSVDSAEYANGAYTIQKTTVETEFPAIDVLLRDIGQDDAYYALVGYATDTGEGYEYKYQYLIRLQKSDDSYTIKSIEQVDEWIQYGSIPSGEQTENGNGDTGTDAQPDGDLMQTESMGGLKIGLTADEVVSMLGDPLTGDWNINEADGEEHQTWSFDGIELDMLRDAQSNIVVNAIKITAPCGLKTLRGIGIGDSYETVLTAYNAEIDPAGQQTDRSELVAGSVYSGVIFSFKNDAVVQIFIGAGAE